MSWFSKKPSDAELFVDFFNKGIAAFHAGDFQLCIDLLLKAFGVVDSEPNKDSVDAWVFIALANMELHSRDKRPQRLVDAEGALLAARVLDHNNRYVVYNLGACYIAQQRFAEAEQCYLDLLKLKPDADALLKLGNICHKTGRKHEAVTYWEKVLTLDPANAAARDNLAKAKMFY